MVKKVLMLGTALCAAVLLAAGPAWSGILNSRHDITATGNTYTWGTTLTQFGACGACHIPHGAGADRLFPSAPTGVAGGFFGPLCASCHIPAGFSGGTDNVWANNSVFAASAHGLQNDDSTATGPGLVQLGSDFNLASTNLAYLTLAQSPRATQVNEIECLSCHDVHNQRSNRPFLMVSLDTLCQECHTNRADANAAANTGYSNPSGNHPVGNAFTGDLGDASGVANNGGPNSPFVSTPALWGTLLVSNTDTGSDGSTWTDAVWNSGMKLTSANGVGCNACHNVHWDDNALIAGNNTFYLAITGDNAGGVNNTFCEYCHQGSTVGSAGGYFWNPGATAYSHPNDDVQSVPIVASDLNYPVRTDTSIYSSQTGSGASELVCTSCHAIHRGDATDPETEPLSPSLLNYDDATYASICDECHGSTPGFNHHPVGGAYATAGSNVGGVSCAGGDLGAGIGTCHGGGTNNGAAHNRTTALGAGVDTNYSAMCVTCHTTNPSTYTQTTPYTASGLASHFVGDAATAGMSRTTTTGAVTTAIRAAGVDTGLGTWSGSGLQSKWGANVSTIICESCHSLKSGNLQTGDGATMMLLEVSGMANDTVASTAAAGSAQYSADVYLCTGCHLVPGGTHPLLNATGSAYTISGGAGQAYTTAGFVNCESCHSAHDADTVTGSYILDAGGTGSGTTGMEIEPTINYTAFCAVCHGAFD